MTLGEFLGMGVTVHLGSHLFEAGEIKAFAAKYDPQPFHMDEEAARKSVFGGLCASGWHTAAVWMKCNVAALRARGAAWKGPEPRPEFGPSPGFRNLKWPKPVFAGETVAFTRTGLAHRALASRPGWLIVTTRAEGLDTSGDKVLEFESAVLVKVA